MILNTTLPDNPLDDWFWERSGDTGSAAVVVNPADPWQTVSNSSFAFNLTGPSTVPEPTSSLILLALGLAGLAVSRKKTPSREGRTLG